MDRFVRELTFRTRKQAVLVRADLRVSTANVVEMKLSIRAESLAAAEAVMESVSS